MDVVYQALLFLHLLSWAIILGGWIATMRKPGLYRGVPHAALTALVTGLLMVGVAEMGSDAELNHMKIGIKTLITVVIVVLAFRAKKQGDNAPRALITSIGVLTVVNVALAIFFAGRHTLG
ncbi:hypothetical protein [Jonesia quinghaiensis]|uniref:hypothetical protein n=1 Tax=Jonesia quinghaiensis TaxID=262806 RepID=UPI00041E87A4|nr:hypothetical protein [Jonesia quinghaiensis]